MSQVYLKVPIEFGESLLPEEVFLLADMGSGFSFSFSFYFHLLFSRITNLKMKRCKNRFDNLVEGHRDNRTSKNFC